MGQVSLERESIVTANVICASCCQSLPLLAHHVPHSSTSCASTSMQLV